MRLFCHFPQINDLLVLFYRGWKQGGLVVFYKEKNMLLAWQSRNVKRVVKSTLIAETLQEPFEASSMIKIMFLEILNVDVHNQILPINYVTDSTSLYDKVYSTKNSNENQLKIKLCAIRKLFEKQEIHYVISAKLVWNTERKSTKLLN